ncbi:hypothetical protein B0H13DRAFT_2524490 [Mycena leptocephala]|nr:hypothetical protein B0H13DRAFT_2524490 [Mycena leptocephala]
MSSLPELQACLSVLPSALPAPGNTTTNNVILIALVIFVAAAGIMHYASPLRLTRVLVTAIANLEKIYLEALERGLLSPSDIDTAEMSSSLQLKVSKIREASLRNSLSFRNPPQFFRRPCIHPPPLHSRDIAGNPTARIQPSPLRALCADVLFYHWYLTLIIELRFDKAA